MAKAATAQKKIAELTPEQWARLETFRTQWRDIGRCAQPADRPTAEVAITEMYRLIGKSAPKFIWLSSPAMSMLALYVLPKLLKSDPAQLRGQLWDQLWDQPWDQSQIWDGNYFWGQHEAYWVAWLLFAEEIGVKYDAENRRRLELWADVARSSCWWWPREGICILSDRPSAVHLVENERADGYELHCEDGPAVAFRDGYSLWSWHGTRVPQQVIEHPETLIASDVMAEANAEVRRVMVERIGMERFMSELNPEVLHEDVDGRGGARRLLRVPMPNDTDRFVVAVHVKCPSTGHDYMLRVPPTMKTCTQAVAWTVGLEEHEYAPVKEP